MTKFLRNIIKEELINVLKEQETIPYGSKGIKVLTIQNNLAKIGFLKKLGKKGIDGIYGNDTKNAVKDFQIKNKLLRKDGTADSQTIKELEKQANSSMISVNQELTKKQSKGKVCQKISGTDEQIQEYDRISQQLIAANVPARSACEISFIKIRPQYKGKSFFVIDTRNKLIYLYDQKGQHVARSPIISGKNAQSENQKLVAEALKYNDEKLADLGYKIINGKYYKNGKYLTDEEVFNVYLKSIDDTKTRFIPKGIYSIGFGFKSTKEIGSESGLNVWRLKLGDKLIGPGFHGLYNDPKRFEYINKVKKKMGGDINNPSVSKAYLDYINKNLGKESGGNMSYGCINVPLEFLEKMRPYMSNSFIFVLGEKEDNYLVQNTNEFFQKSESQEDIKQYAELYPNKTPLGLPSQEQPGQEEKAYA